MSGLASAIGRFFTRHRSLEDVEETGPRELEPGFRASNMKKRVCPLLLVSLEPEGQARVALSLSDITQKCKIRQDLWIQCVPNHGIQVL
jgi:hypothetical protein